jgi:hypothetical protein
MAVEIGSGGGAVFNRGTTTVSANTTLTNGNNYVSFGPVTVNAGITVTINTGATWSIV